MKQVLLSHSIC